MRMASEVVADTRRVPVLLRMIRIGTTRHHWPLGASLSEADPSLPFHSYWTFQDMMMLLTLFLTKEKLFGTKESTEQCQLLEKLS